MNYLIFGLASILGFVCWGYFFPKGTRTKAGGESVEAADAVRPRVLDSTRLSRIGAISVSVCLAAIFGTALALAPTLDPLVAVGIMATSLWAAADSEKVKLRSYQTLLAIHPVILFNLMNFFWPALFPWYLILCSKIGDGTLPRRSQHNLQ